MSIMANNHYDEAIIDVVGPEALLSKAYPIKVSLGLFVINRKYPSDHIPRTSYSVTSLHGNLSSRRLSDWFPLLNVEQKSTLSSYILTLSSRHQVYPYPHSLK